MQKAAHSMRLRSRSNMNRSNIETTIMNSTASNGRSILGEISNKRSVPEENYDGTVKAKAKKFRTGFNPLSNVNKNEYSSAVISQRNNVSCENKENSTNGTQIPTDEPAPVAGHKRKRCKQPQPDTGIRVTRSSNKNCDTDDNSAQSGRDKKKIKGDTSDAVGEDHETKVRDRSRQTDAIDQRVFSRSEEREDIEPRNLTACLIPEEYRLQRNNYDATVHTNGVAPHDRVDRGDVLMTTEYVTDLFQHLFKEETFSRPKMYMGNQRDINARMRAILVDWLVEVHMKFRLVPETLYLCINIIDRYCNFVQVARSRLQLVGVTALLIACKYEEIYPPEVRDCVYITDRAYHRQEVLDMEQDMLQRLRFKITVPTAYPFLLRFLNLVKASPLTRNAANYYMERTLQEHDLLQFRPSLVSAATVILALNNPDIHRKDNAPIIEHPGGEASNLLLEYTGFNKKELLECSAIIAVKIGEEPVTASRRQLVAVKRKYDNRKYHHVSKMVELPTDSTIPFKSNFGTTDRE